MSRSRQQFTELQYLEGLRSGDSEVLNALYKKHYPLVLRFVVNNSGTEEAARDVYQEAVIVLYEAAQKPGFQLNCQVQTFLYSVARRLWLKQLRSSGKTYLFREEEDENELADVGSEVDAHQQKEKDLERISRSLEALGEPCASLIREFYIGKRSMEEIAARFGYTNADNAKTQKYKCLQRLKKFFLRTVR